MAEENKDNYVVLARKYRPQSFNELLGQDALVKTITNAIKNNRLHHAYILTGIRGVGKTTTARIIAKALNCTGKDALNGATINPCGICENCRAIAESRHIDVLELDAASHTGVGDIREILDGVRYKPTNGRYKVYIIDEVHMLSNSAFNALLKTLEEPPSHVIFIFATTEIRKVPVTILSRCQRFDLQRLGIELLMEHFKNIAQKEGFNAEEEALHLIAKAADGSCRDGLSLLDQAISLGMGDVKTDIVKEMIGLADRGQTFELFESLISGKIDDVMTNIAKQYNDGANPLTVLQDLINVTHLLAKVKIVAESINDASLSENEKAFCTRVAPQVSISVLSKMWQMFIKGLSEINVAPSQSDALEMVLIRVAYSANLPTPAELLDGLKKNSDLNVIQTNNFNENVLPKNVVSSETASDKPVFNTPQDLVDYLIATRKMMLSYSIKNDISFSDFSNGKMKISVSEKINNDFLLNLQNVLKEATGIKWEIDVLSTPLGQTLADKEAEKDMMQKKDVMDLPLVKAIMAEFKGAKIESLTRKIVEQAEKDEEFMVDDLIYIEEEN
ncbi:MAG: DNA polymerase III subunit gamma/tau [Alphaproteobacteria bacterium]|nr:DNA polymerase III subunit gamma/tau [Alphaproteobacteria bacterium]